MKLCFPEKILHQHGVVLGKTGSGKSSKLRHIVEHLLAHNKRVCIVDPKGDWWGLKSSADGKSAGCPVIAFGDFKEPKASDVPINAQSGKHIAELVTSGNRPCIIGMRGWMPAHLVKFWLDFAPSLFNAQSGELYLVIDEVHNFAPKGKILDPEAGRCIHWTNRLMSEGRGLGLICFIASQRPQKVHNDTLTCCETLIAARVIHKADRNAVKDWIDGCGDSDKGAEVLNGLAQLDRTQAWVWSPESDFGPKIVEFPMFETFDSFAPPQLQKKISNEGWSTVNLDDVKAKLASVIEEAKANDPAELKRQLAEAKRELKRRDAETQRISPANTKVKSDPADKNIIRAIKSELSQTMKSLEEAMKFIVEITTRNFGETISKEEIEKAVLTAANSAMAQVEKKFDARKQEMAQLKTTAERVLERIKKLTSETIHVSLDVKHNEPFTVSKPIPARTFSRPDRSSVLLNGDSEISPKGQKILNALAEMEMLNANNPVREIIALLAGYTNLKSDGFVKATSQLRSHGLIDYPDSETICLTDTGKSAAHYPDAPRSSEEIQNRVCALIGGKSSEILRPLIDNHPEALLREDVARAAGYTNLKSDGFVKATSRLRTLGFVDYPDTQTIRATDVLFLK